MNIVQIFQQIRDVPYSIPLSTDEVDNSCSGKTVRLKKALDEIGFKTRYRVCDFGWSDLPLPLELLALPHEDNATHVYLEVCVDDVWVSVDPSWDSQLGHVFLISEWDGESHTHIAVTPLRLYSHEESERIMEHINPKEIESDVEKNSVFYRALNTWLSSQRQ